MTLTQINRAGLDEIALDHVFTIGASGNSAYTFQGEGLNGTVNNPTLYLTRGQTYRFVNVSGAHPLQIQSTQGASGTAYNTGVTGNSGGSQTVVVEVQHDAPDILYYQCTSHAAMNGILYITGALADGGVTTAKLADSGVTTAKIANDAVTSAKIANGAVTVNELGATAVTNAKLATSAVGAGNLQQNAVETDKIQDSAVTTAKIADGAVTTAKIPDDAITGGKIGQVINNTHITATANIARSKLANVDVVDDTTPVLGGILDTGGYDVQFKDGSGNVKILFDASQDALEVADNAAIMFGDHPDIELAYSNGNDFSIAGQYNGLGDIVTGFKNVGGNILKAIRAVRSTQAVELFFGDSKKAETVTGGFTVTGTVSDSKGDLRKIPYGTVQTSSYTLVAADAGKAVPSTSGGWTVPNNVFSAGDAVTLLNASGSDMTITQGAGFNLYDSANAGATGNRTLATRGMATIYFASAGGAYISGSGLS
tara:strand:- start:1244 stop:2692 length:1449 start_codon:yes stop_codon:yes gene_type:complete